MNKEKLNQLYSLYEEIKKTVRETINRDDVILLDQYIDLHNNIIKDLYNNHNVNFLRIFYLEPFEYSNKIFLLFDKIYDKNYEINHFV